MKKSYFFMTILVFALQVFTGQLNAQCITPTGLAATGITTNGAYLYSNSTTTSATQYNIRYHSSNVTTWTVLEHVTLPYQLVNLGCNTTYVWQAQQICVSPAGITSVSDWSSVATFTTALCTAPPPAPCLPPTGLLSSNLSQTSAYLHLNTATANALLYNIRYHDLGTATWTYVEHVSLPYQLGNLACGTTYEWQAHLICTNSAGTTSSDWSAGATFTTLACTTTPCNAPTGLSATNVSQTGAYLYLTPTSSNAGTFNIRYHAGPSLTWTTIEHVTLPYQLGNLACGTVYEWQAQLICTNSATGATTTVSPWSAGGTFTTLPCTAPTCNPPIGLSATNVTQTGASLYLSPTSSNTGMFNIRYHGANATTWTTLEHVTLPYQLGNLACGSTYEWQAQLICTNPITGAPISTVSPWSAGGTFTTLPCTVTPCNAPTGLSSTNVTQTGASLYLSPTSSNAGTFNIRYHGANATTWTTLEHVTLPYQLGNLACGSTYEWQAQLICPNTIGTTTSSPWSAGGAFTTLPCTVTPCNAPTGLSATNVTQTGAYLYLSPTSSNTGTFNIRYHARPSLTWTTIEHVTLPYQLGNLACGTVYEWQAQRICPNTIGTTTSSSWSAGGTFTTLPCTVTPCNTSTGLSATNMSQTGAYLYLSPTSGNTGTFNIRYHGPNATWTTLEHVTLPYQLGNLACGTTYEWQAQLICPATAGTAAITVSPWSTAGVFTTLACTTPTCTTPIGLSATNVSHTGAYLYLSPTSSNTGTFNIRYHGPNATWTTLEHVTLPYQLGNLACGTTYEWQAQLICPATAGTAAITVSPWSTAGTFTTLACTTTPCNAPTGLSATNVSQNGANLYLSPTSSNTGTFNIRYHGANGTTWTTLEHVTLPYQLGNLACGSTYEWQAQLICTNSAAAAPTTTVSPWSAGGTFTTLPCTTQTCGTPTGLHATDINPTSAILHWNAVPGAVAYIVRYKKAINTTLEFTTVTTTSNAITLNSLTAGSYYIWQVQAVCSTTVGGVSPFSTMATFVTPAVILFPNPASGFVNVSFWLDKTSTTTIVLWDSHGQVVYSLVTSGQVGANNVVINTTGLSVGLYFLSIQTNAYSTTKKLVIGH